MRWGLMGEGEPKKALVLSELFGCCTERNGGAHCGLGSLGGRREHIHPDSSIESENGF
jgi:hypothetical protein